MAAAVAVGAASGAPAATHTVGAAHAPVDHDTEPVAGFWAAEHTTRQPRARTAMVQQRSMAAGVQVYMGPPPTPLDEGANPSTRPRITASVSPISVGQAALERISYPWASQLPGWSIEFHHERSQLRGLTLDNERRIEIYVHTDNVEAVARVLAHELGHAVDITHNDTGRRRQWEAARGIGDAVPWWPTPGQPDFSTGAGDFAECFAAWQIGSVSRSDFGSCSAADLEMMAGLARN